jgi:hypothetical protein
MLSLLALSPQRATLNAGGRDWCLDRLVRLTLLADVRPELRLVANTRAIG